VLRRSRGLGWTVLHGRDGFDVEHRPTRTFTAAQIGEVVAAASRNRWVPFSAMAGATLKRGIVDHSLHVDLGANRRAKFLWLSRDGGFDLLEEALDRALPGRLRVVRAPIG
jgi:hypothetical protein